MKPLSEIEWTTCWMAIRYACPRQTIASATLPSDLIKAYWNRWTVGQKKMIAQDLKRFLETESSFGNKNIDEPIWNKFLSACDIDNHETVELIDGTSCVVFEANDRYYPLDEYVKKPHAEIYVPIENIKIKP